MKLNRLNCFSVVPRKLRHGKPYGVWFTVVVTGVVM